MSGRTDKDRRTPEEANYAELLIELKKRPERPIEVIAEDQATLEGLIDLLVVKGIITETELNPYLIRYQSVMTALVMILVVKGIITDADMEKATLAYHFTIRNSRPNATGDEIFESRRNYLNRMMEF